jgi:glycosyltransferase involved in cell wall biosynthesis
MPSVTCVMPTFQQAQYLDEAVDSILGQTHRDLRLLIVSVEGDDETNRIVDVMVADQPDRIANIRSKYACIPHQMNLGFSRVNTDYAFLAASDDVWLPTICENSVKIAEDTAALVVYPKWYIGDAKACIVSERSDVPKAFDLAKFEQRCYVTDCSLVFTEAFKRFLPMRLESGWHYIYDLWKRMARAYPERFAHIDEAAFVYRQHASSEHVTKTATQEKKYQPVVLGENAALLAHYKAWPFAEFPLGRKNVVYVPDPKALVGREADVRFRKVLVHWTRGTYSRHLADQLADFPYIHITDDPDLEGGLIPRPCYRVALGRDVYWWLLNDVYEGLGQY